MLRCKLERAHHARRCQDGVPVRVMHWSQVPNFALCFAVLIKAGSFWLVYGRKISHTLQCSVHSCTCNEPNDGSMDVNRITKDKGAVQLIEALKKLHSSCTHQLRSQYLTTLVG